MAIPIFISNLSEDVWPFIQSMDDRFARRSEIAENADLSDRDLFSLDSKPEIVLITPRSISSQFLKYCHQFFPSRQLTILTPRHHSGQICLDILRDQKIINKLIELKDIDLIPYSTTPQFLKLVEFLKNEHISVSTSESPSAKDAWMINFFGTKSGFRQLVQSSPKLLMPRGYITSTIDQAVNVAINLFPRTGGIVIKTNKGHCGAGVLIFTEAFTEDEIIKQLQANSYWLKFPIIVESYIKPNLEIGGGFPNVECFIDASGQVNVLYLCGMKVGPDGVFYGVEIGKSVFSPVMKNKLTQIAKFIGRQYAVNGYHGYFEFDFIAGVDGRLYLSESNIRRTGGTHVYHTARHLFGSNFANKTYSFSRNVRELKQKYSFSQIKKILKPILFDPKTKEGLIIISENLLTQKKIAYIIFAVDSQRAHQIESTMSQIFDSQF